MSWPRVEDAFVVGQHAHLERAERRQRRPRVAYALEGKARVATRVLQQDLRSTGMLQRAEREIRLQFLVIKVSKQVAGRR